MRVLHLKAENFLRLRAVEVTPKGDIVKVSGANGEGKTSTLDAIWAVLDHRRLNVEQPIHKGAKKAVIRLNMGEFTAQRTITAKGSELTITAADGTKVSSPQKFLDDLIGELSFDPLAFDRMRPLDQVAQLRALAPLDVDFDQIDKLNEADFNRRTEVNRQAKQKRAEAEAIPPAPRAGLIDEQPILDKINNAGKHNAELEGRRRKRADVSREAAEHRAKVEQANAAIAELELQLTAAREARDHHAAEAEAKQARLDNAPALPAAIDVTEATAELVRAQEHNAGIKAEYRRLEIEAEALALEQQAAALTDAIDQRNASKEEAVAKAKMPVPGLGYGNGMVMFNDLPYAQASAAERLRISMSIAMAANPKIRVIRIADGSLLDSKSMAIIGELAKANDFQVWVEVVDETKKIGIVIEDGVVAKVNDEA